MVFCGSIIAQKSPSYEGYTGFYSNQNFLSLPIALLVCSFAVVFGCRWGVGVDFYGYYYSYIYEGGERHELLYRLVERFFRNNGFHFAFYFGFWALWDIALMFYCVKNYKFLFPYLALMLMITSMYLSMMNAMRQHAAMGVFLVSLQFIDEKKPLNFYLCCLFAFLLHKSAVVVSVLYPILFKRNDWFKNVFLQVALYVVCFVLHFYFSSVIEWIEKPFTWFAESFDYENYNMDMLLNDRWSRDKFGRSTGFGLVANVLRTLPVILYSKKMKSYFNSSFFEILYSIWFVGVLASLLFGNSIILNRVVMYFRQVQPIIYSFFMYYCFSTKRVENTLIGIGMILLFVLLFLNIISNPDSTAQFTFFWQYQN
jgi:hypothetical protein